MEFLFIIILLFLFETFFVVKKNPVFLRNRWPAMKQSTAIEVISRRLFEGDHPLFRAREEKKKGV